MNIGISAFIAVLSGVLYVNSGNYHEKFIDQALTGNSLPRAQLSSLNEGFGRVAHVLRNSSREAHEIQSQW